MVELVDTADLKSVGRKVVGVQVPLLLLREFSYLVKAADS